VCDPTGDGVGLLSLGAASLQVMEQRHDPHEDRPGATLTDLPAGLVREIGDRDEVAVTKPVATGGAVGLGGLDGRLGRLGNGGNHGRELLTCRRRDPRLP
jgi:hypothetical protein